MAYTISLQPKAEEDIGDAFAYYSAVSTELAESFFDAVEACLARVEYNPLGYPTVYKHIRRALLHRFPYSILYFVEDQDIIVIACFHASRDPKTWQSHV